VKIRIDTDSCTGHGRCYAIAPELFDASDEDGYGIVLGDGVVSEIQVPFARQAAKNCPERAVVLEE